MIQGFPRTSSSVNTLKIRNELIKINPDYWPGMIFPYHLQISFHCLFLNRFMFETIDRLPHTVNFLYFVISDEQLGKDVMDTKFQT